MEAARSSKIRSRQVVNGLTESELSAYLNESSMKTKDLPLPPDHLT